EFGILRSIAAPHLSSQLDVRKTGLAERVGPTGEVVGLDREARMLSAARSLAAERRLDNVRLVQGDASATGLPQGSMDLVHTRTLLVNHPDPYGVVGEMVALARPGGIVVAQEPDCSTWICEPGHPSWDRLMTLLQDHYRAQGRDPCIGRRLREMLRDAGLAGVKANVRAGCVTEPGDWYHTLLPTFSGLLRAQIIAGGLCEVDELDALITELHSHLSEPGTLTMVPLWQAWGRR
ncbi:MAG: methyltransferase domain-containing protein, partial [Egibacteraceae bacterium]